MRDAVIVSAVRTAVGKAPKGTLKNTRPDDMGAAAIKEAINRVDNLDVTQIEDVMPNVADALEVVLEIYQDTNKPLPPILQPMAQDSPLWTETLIEVKAA